VSTKPVSIHYLLRGGIGRTGGGGGGASYMILHTSSLINYIIVTIMSHSINLFISFAIA